MEPSSADLHPKHGARFVVTRDGEGFDVEVYTGTERDVPPTVLRARLTFNDAGQPTLEPELDDAWVRDETLKLARVLKRGTKDRLSRWRGEPL